MSFPYPDDPLNQANKEDASARNSFYGPYTSTPKTFFDGVIQSNNYVQWDEIIDSRTAVNTPIKIELAGTKEEDAFTINADISMSQNTPAGDYVIYFVVVEDIVYTGRNGVSDHKNVMRGMYPSASGQSISVYQNQNISRSINLQPDWNTDNLGVVVFIQSKSTKEVFQSDWIDYSELVITYVAENINQPEEFILYQNYPNPFGTANHFAESSGTDNPTTKIKFSVSPLTGGVGAGLNALTGRGDFAEVRLVIYDILGSEVAMLVNETKAPGTYDVVFNGNGLASGIYFATLTVSDNQGAKVFTITKKMILAK